MSRSFSISRVMLLAAMAGLMILAALGFRAQEKDREGFKQSSKENIHWASAQVEVELARFVATLSLYSAGDPNVTADDVNRRFDIFWSRTGVFRSGEVGERLRAFDSDIQVIPDVTALLEKHEPAVVNIRRGNTAAHLRIVNDFLAVDDRLRRLSVRVLSGEELRFARVRENMRASGLLTWFVSTAALVLTSILVAVMLIENRRYKRTADEASKLAERAETANQAKSRFLTMMSHELRTPMNGVLGLMALAKQSGLNERQRRLIEQAERSGEQMTALLADILDFSDLQAETLEIDRKPFDPAELGRAVADAIKPSVQRTARNFRVQPTLPAKEWVVGDMMRLRQALNHFCTYMIEIVGSEDISLTISHRNDRLACVIDIAVHGHEHPGWQPEAMFGGDDTAFDSFGSDALGPTIARGLIALMGGSVVLTRTEPGRACLTVSVPAEAVPPITRVVRIEAQSDTSGMMLRAVINSSKLKVWEPDDEREAVSAVLIETESSDEAAIVARLRAEHPGALVIGLGSTNLVELYDRILPVPLTESALRSALSNDLASAIA